MKMNFSMEFLKPLTGTIKKYSALLPSVIITVVGLLLFLPTMLIGSKVQDAMDNSVRMASSVQRLLQDGVPSEDEPEQLQIYMNKLQEAADRIETLAIQSSRRDLVTYDYVIFPEPQDRSSQIFAIFGDRFREKIESLITKMNASDAPSDEEIRSRSGSARRTTESRSLRTQDAADTEDPVIDAICLGRAQEISVYANPSAFLWYSFWEEYEFSGKDAALEDCWDAQVAFWIYEDIVDTIIRMNGTTGSVGSLPVKRLLGVSFRGPVVVQDQTRPSMRTRFMGQTGDRVTGDIPNYITPTSMSYFLGDSPTGRVSDEEIDVIHFAVSVLVDSRHVFAFMKELCSEKSHVFYPSIFEEPFIRKGEAVQGRHNQIAILKNDISVVDKTDLDHEYYRYGKGAVMRLDLVCEYIFTRAGYDNIKPDPVKIRIGQLEETQDEEMPAGASGMGPGGMMY